MFNQYQPNIDNMQQYLNQENERSRGEGPNWWSIPSGMSSVRILPPWDPTGRVSLPVFMHPIEFQGQGMSYKKYNWTCVNKTFNKPCPICGGLAEMAAAGVDISNWEANRRQFYFNAIVMHDPTYDPAKKSGVAPGTHVLMKAPKTFYDWVIAQITNPMIGDVTNVQTGIDIYVTKEGSGLGTTYNMTLSPNGRTPVPQEYLDKITDLYNLDDIFSVGFDQAQIDELVNHLKKSAGVMSSGVGQVVNQMAGYTQAPNPGVFPQGGLNYQSANKNWSAPSVTQTAPPWEQQPVAGYPTLGNPYANQSNSVSAPAPTFPATSVASTPAPSAHFSSMPEPAPTPYSPSTKAQSEATNLPKCFGNYDPGSVNCVVCPYEVNCSQSKQ